jgi:hypothetical protein
MIKRKLYICLLVLQFLIGTDILYAQVQNDSIETDTTMILAGIANPLDYYNTKWITIGSQYDYFNSTFGLEISNGYDERPLIHFEDFSEDFVFKIQGNTDFNRDYSYGINIGWKYPRYLSLIAIGFSDYDYSLSNFQFQELNISAETNLKNTDFVVKLELAYHVLNNRENFGAELGLSNVFIYRRLYAGLSSGYYFDYFTYSGFIKSFVYKNTIGIALKYDRIDKYDFLQLGLSYTFTR